MPLFSSTLALLLVLGCLLALGSSWLSRALGTQHSTQHKVCFLLYPISYIKYETT